MPRNNAYIPERTVQRKQVAFPLDQTVIASTVIAAPGEGQNTGNPDTATTTPPGAIKCRVVSASNIALDSTTTAVDGVTLADDDVVLVTGQTDATQNRAWIANTGGSWQSLDAIDNNTMFVVSAGTTYADSLWKVTTDGTITVGTTNITIERIDGIGVDIDGTVRHGRGFAFTSTLGTWSHDGVDGNGRYVLNYEPPTIAEIIQCRVVSTSNIALNNTTTSVDGVTLANADKILVAGQSTASQNGVYTVNTSGAWSRSSDAIDANTYFSVAEGTEYKDSLWRVTTNGAIDVGTTALEITFYGGTTINLVGTGVKSHAWGFAIQAGSGMTITQSSSDGIGRPIYTFAASSGVPSGTDTQTLRYNGTTLTATSTLRVGASTVGIGVAPQSSEVLYVQATGTNTAIAAATGGAATTASAVYGFSQQGYAVRGQAQTGRAGYFVAISSGYGSWSESSSGYGAYCKSVSSYGVFAESRQHGAAFIYQTGTLSANNTTPVLTCTRNLTLSGFTADEPLIMADDQSGSGAPILTGKKAGTEVFGISEDGGISCTPVDIDLSVTSGDNLSVGRRSTVRFDTGSSARSLTGISATGIKDGHRLHFYVAAGDSGTLTIRHSNLSSFAGNRFYTSTNADVPNVKGGVLIYNATGGFWHVVSYVTT